MKYIYILAFVVLIVGGVLFVLFGSKTPEGVPKARIEETPIQNEDIAKESVKSSKAERATTTSVYNISNLKFSFTGYGPGKEHVGSFSDIKTSDVEVNEKNMPTKGVLTIITNSISAGIEDLDTHLKSEDFFDVATYPEITFTFKKATLVGVNYNILGTLVFRGISKDISFDVMRKGNDFSSDFLLDVTPFKFKYIGINKNVRIQFSFMVQQ